LQFLDEAQVEKILPFSKREEIILFSFLKKYLSLLFQKLHLLIEFRYFKY
jgi:hypothetical protein